MRKGSVRVFEPVGVDLWQPIPKGPKPGDRVRVTTAAHVGQAPKPWIYVEDAETGDFRGMVLRASLKKTA